MRVLTTARTPSSYQFRLAAFNSRKFFEVHLLRIRFHKPEHQARCLSASRDNGNANVAELPTNSTFSGWFVDNNIGSQEPNESKPKVSWSGRILVAGVIIVAGVTFAVFSISKNSSVSKQKMEPLATHLEESLSSADQNDAIEVTESKEDNTLLENRHLEGKTGKVLVPSVVDQVQGQTLAALQALKVIEGDVKPGDICTRREYARWLLSASSVLSRNAISKVYPAMYIENVTELAFDDITSDDPDFSSIQGLAEAGVISSKLSRNDTSPSDENENSFIFCPESPLSRQDLVSWKMCLGKRLLPVADIMILQQCSGFIDIEKINPDVWPALIADLSAGEQGIVALAFGYTRLFQPNKPVTKAQAAVALACGEASDIASEELARIEAEYSAEKAVAAHCALVDQVEKDINSKFENDYLLKMEKIPTVEKMTEDVKHDIEKLKDEHEKENIKLMEERGAVDSEMEIFSKLRHGVEEQLQSIVSNKVEILHEKGRLKKLRTDLEIENQEIVRLQDELEVERKALSLARSWAEDEANRTREQAKVLEEARNHWKSQGIKVVVDDDLHEEANAGATWLSAATQFSIQGTKKRALNLVDKLEVMAINIKGGSEETIDRIIQKLLLLVSQLEEWLSKAVEKLPQKFKT